MKQLTYPSGRIVNYAPDSAGRLISVIDGNGSTYVSSATYNAADSLTGFTNGTGRKGTGERGQPELSDLF